MMTLTDEQKNEIVLAAAADIRAKTIENVSADLSRWTRQAVVDSIDESIKQMVRDEIMPAVREELMLKKPILVAAAVDAAGAMASAVSEAMVKRVTERLAKDYDANKMFEAMLGTGRGY